MQASDRKVLTRKRVKIYSINCLRATKVRYANRCRMLTSSFNLSRSRKTNLRKVWLMSQSIGNQLKFTLEKKTFTILEKSITSLKLQPKNRSLKARFSRKRSKSRVILELHPKNLQLKNPPISLNHQFKLKYLTLQVLFNSSQSG